jgi:uncharacterized protein (DUF302 family)
MKTKSLTALIILLCAISTQSYATDSNGIIKIKSKHTVTETIDKLETVLNKKGMTIFKRVNHAAGAEKAGLKLRPTELLIFGNPKVGTPLMLCSQTAALDLPLKALAYKDENGQVWLAYNDPGYIAKRHHVSNCGQVTNKMSKALANFSKAATE